MYKVPLPDAVNSLGAMGGTQGTYGIGPKPAGEQTQNNDATQMNTIFASLDGDKSANVTKTEAQTQISQGFQNVMTPGNVNVFMKMAQLTGFSDVTHYAKSLYATASNSFQNIDSGSKEVAQGETAQAQQELDNSVQNEINAQIKNINKEVQDKYVEVLMQANREVAQEEHELFASQLADQPNQEVAQQQPEYNMQFSGIHNQPSNHDGTRIRGAGLEFTSGNKKVGFNIESTDSAKIYGRIGNLSGYAKFDINPGYTTTAEGGKYSKNYVEAGVSYTFNGGHHNKPKNKSVY